MQVRDRVKGLRRVRASELAANPRNWRTHPERQRLALRGVLGEVGVADALVAYESERAGGKLVLIDGHLRAEEAPDHEWPVLVLDLDDAEADKLLAVLDPLAGMAGADPARLEALLAEIGTECEAVAALLTETALAAGATGRRSADDPAGGGDGFDPTPEEQGPTRTRPGEVWVIGGRHRLLVGDCTDAGGVARLFDGERAGLCFTSPPYAQQREYGEAAKEKVLDWHALMCGAFAPLADHLIPDGQVLVNLGLVHRDGEWVPYWDGWIGWMREQGWRRFGWYVWDQGNGLPGDWRGRFAPSHEWVFHFNRESVNPDKTVAKKPYSKPMGSNLRNSNGVNREPSSICSDPDKIPDSVVRVNRCSRHGTGHPATFPIPLPSAFVECWPGAVYDPFLGSGTTLVAAHRLGRVCYGCEIEPRYADVILKRAEAEGMGVERAG